MKLNKLLFILFFALSFSGGLSGICPEICESDQMYVEQDTLGNIQVLYNGIYWRNHYYRVKEDQFLFSRDFLSGSLSISGKSFKNLEIRYDIFNDEIMIPTNYGAVVQLNKEMVDSFTIRYNGTTYKFDKIEGDSIRGFTGYVNVLHKGKTALYVKYKKEIELLAVDRKYDMFFQTHRVFFVKDSIIYQINGRADLLKALGDKNSEIKTFIKKDRIKVSRKRPESFIPVLRYYDSISL